MKRTINRVVLVGFVTKDLEIRTNESGTVSAFFCVETYEKYYSKKTCLSNEFIESHKVVCFNTIADFVSQSVKPGDKIYIEGKLQTKSYTDKSGVERFITEVLAQTIVVMNDKEMEDCFDDAEEDEANGNDISFSSQYKPLTMHTPAKKPEISVKYLRRPRLKKDSIT